MDGLHVNHPKMQQVVDAIVGESNHYSGGPLRDFECVGRDAFIHLLLHGLLPHHRLLDFGCGSLRLGYWLIRFLDPNCYFGIDPIPKGVDAGLKYAVGDELAAIKRPKFEFIGNCDMTAFGQTFDYVVARSILTHTTPGMLHLILKQFAAVTSTGVFLASYWRTDGEYVIDTSHVEGKYETAIGDDLPDDDHRFIAFVKFSWPYIQAAAERASLNVEELNDLEPINQQIWLKFTPQ